jgi:hypothetical protein
MLSAPPYAGYARASSHISRYTSAIRRAIAPRHVAPLRRAIRRLMLSAMLDIEETQRFGAY